jgi:hypothetical protein
MPIRLTELVKRVSPGVEARVRRTREQARRYPADYQPPDEPLTLGRYLNHPVLLDGMGPSSSLIYNESDTPRRARRAREREAWGGCHLRHQPDQPSGGLLDAVLAP